MAFWLNNDSRKHLPVAPEASGFTLIELSIVLVIIGLLVGGVLVGQDLIHNAEVRSSIGQIEKIKTAINTFQGKYGCLPGDCVRYAQYGFQTRSNVDGHGDGDGRYENCLPAQSHYAEGCENTLLWRDLAAANLIEGSFTTATDANAAISAANFPLYFPKSTMGGGNYIMVYNSMNTPGIHSYIPKYSNLFSITGMASISADGSIDTVSALTPLQSYQFDLKTDDGAPTGGSVYGGTNQEFFFYAGAPWADSCSITNTEYNLDPAWANEKICVLNVRM